MSLDRRWVFTYAVAVFFDMLDYVAFYITMLPGVGDLIDFVALIALTPLIGKYALLNVAEFIPGADFIPTNTIAVVMAQREMLGSPYRLGLSSK